MGGIRLLTLMERCSKHICSNEGGVRGEVDGDDNGS